ncbi:recQ-mediated genome instability protein 1 [Heteronotia binoei]|uniref:recQ-mediated genome instability protein 1 n=1 Tax=Heteronotia binoei TaxID=13085 RepID=UPI00292E5402|nr:recQ-mediated genome instability protein 1 [Heteronotia binoei]XP_060091397.1 recQ-mediated genome instability protein 1 [Heteronotia binoei]
MSVSSAAVRVETWLSSTWHVKVPVPWLQACIDWIQEENGLSNLTQAYINKQVFEQWLLTDLRDLEYPVLPDCILNAPKGELKGFYSIQIDSLIDVSQPAYSQLQKIRGKNTVNEEITANTQGTQKSWEAKPTRMLMLKLTDGINHIQGMEYHSVPVLHSSLPPGTKIMIQGKVSYRLGVLLLKPENVRLLGGEVDSLMEECAEERVLAKLIGEDDFSNSVRSVIGDPGISRPADEVGQVLGPSDEELLASLEENDELIINEAPLESGYCSRSTSSNSNMYSLLPNNASCSDQGSAIFIAASDQPTVPVSEYNEQGLDEFPLDDDLLLVEEIHEQSLNRNNPNRADKSVKRGMYDVFDNNDVFENSAGDFLINLDDCSENKFIRERCCKRDVIGNKEKSSDISNNRVTDTNANPNQYSDHVQAYEIKDKYLKVNLDTPPFTYISVLLSNKLQGITHVKVKAFIVTLTGKLTSSSGLWSVTAKISDGTAYLEVDFANDILTSLIGFSVPEMKQLKKDPVLHPKLKKGLCSCQRELIDLCCLMTIEFNPSEAKAIVIVLQDINANDLNNLKRRLNIFSI